MKKSAFCLLAAAAMALSVLIMPTAVSAAEPNPDYFGVWSWTDGTNSETLSICADSVHVIMTFGDNTWDYTVGDITWDFSPIDPEQASYLYGLGYRDVAQLDGTLWYKLSPFPAIEVGDLATPAIISLHPDSGVMYDAMQGTELTYEGAVTTCPVSPFDDEDEENEEGEDTEGGIGAPGSGYFAQGGTDSATGAFVPVAVVTAIAAGAFLAAKTIWYNKNA